MALEIRPPLAYGGRDDRRLRDRDGWDGISDDPPVLQHQERLATLQRTRPMRDQEHRAAAHQMPHRAEDYCFRFRIHGARRLVEDEDGAVLEEGAGERDALSLASRELRAALPDVGVVAAGQAHNELVRIG